MKAMILTLALAALVQAQEIPPLAPLRGDAATLKDTMKFLQDKLPGKVNYIVYEHDNVAGTDSATKRSFALEVVSADPNRCFVGLHYRFDNGKTVIEPPKGVGIFLKQVQEVALKQLDQVVQEAEAKEGHPELSVKIDPPISLVTIKTPTASLMFNFYDQTLSERVSKALQHAVELCGGGNQEPF
jgi:hypothetical protein